MASIICSPAKALIINPTFDPSIGTNLSPADASNFVLDVNYSIAQYENLFTDPITLNITFKSNPGSDILGRTVSSTQAVAGNFIGIKAALAADAKSGDDQTAVANLPGTDPTSGANFYATRGEAKALGLRAANDPATDATIQIGAGFDYAYDPNNRAVPGDYDFIGLTEHEISEAMGRVGMLGFFGRYDALDLFGYTASGALDLARNQSGVYFSIDGGNTLLKLYNDPTYGGDSKDWDGGTNDSYNAFVSDGVENDISAVDVRELDVIGYDLAVPEPASITILSLAAIGILHRPKRDAYTALPLPR